MYNSKNTLEMNEPLSKATPPMFGLPFDIARIMYTLTVRTGLVKDSMLASARFSRDLSALENLTLGPWARQV